MIVYGSILSGDIMKTPLDEIFREHGGQLRMSEAIALGSTRYMLYSMRDKGIIEQVTRGVYRLAELPSLSDPDLVTVGLRCPNAVICLVSALSYHAITTQIPHEVYIAVTRDSRIPVLDHPPIRVFRFSVASFMAGIEEHRVDGVRIRVFSPEKTLADCFKYRNKIGMDVVLEALKLSMARKKLDIAKLLAYARICRVEKVMRPYLEAMV